VPRSTTRLAPGRTRQRPPREAVRLLALLEPPSRRISQESTSNRSSGPAAAFDRLSVVPHGGDHLARGHHAGGYGSLGRPLDGEVQEGSQGTGRDPAHEGGPVCGGLEHRDECGAGLPGIEVSFVLGSPFTVHDAVEGQWRLEERELGDVRADQSRLDRDDRSRAEPEEPTGAGGVQEGAEVFDLGAQPVEFSVRSAPATATPVRYVDRELTGEGVGKPGEVSRRLARSVQEDDRWTGSDPLVSDRAAVTGADLAKSGPWISGAEILVHRPDARPAAIGKDACATCRSGRPHAWPPTQ